MITIPRPNLICYPPAPLNGGSLESAPAKVGTWIWQPKPDDRRVVIHTPSRTIWNQYGQLSVANDSEKFEVALDRLENVSFFAEWLDAGLMEYRNDMMRGCIIVFDLIERGLTSDERRERLAVTFDPLPWATELVGTAEARNQVYLIPQWCPDRYVGGFGVHPMELYDRLKNENAQLDRKFYEGLVAKRADSLYPFGNRPKQQTADWIKHRFDQ
jgi:hypothetical protein